eukprot:5530101-Pyramimonas_sp.AAC.1
MTRSNLNLCLAPTIPPKKTKTSKWPPFRRAQPSRADEVELECATGTHYAAPQTVLESGGAVEARSPPGLA